MTPGTRLAIRAENEWSTNNGANALRGARGRRPQERNHTYNFMLRAVAPRVNDWQKTVAHILGRKPTAIRVLAVNLTGRAADICQ